MIAEPALLTSKDVMKQLKISRSTLWRLMEAGTLPGYKVGHTWRYYQEDVRACVRLENATKQGPKCACNKDFSQCDYPDC